jgi:hypothetical protein
VDSLSTIRKLKEKNVECFFEKEGIWTFDGKGELLITIMSSLAQEESRSISENVTWGHRKRMADGKVSLPYSSFLGYKKGADGLPEIVPEEAEIVRFIYRSFLEGMTTYSIGKKLMQKGIPSPSGKETWYASTIESILKNEKYKGSALLQKNFTVDFLTKKVAKNEGQVPQYYIAESHEAIIPPEEFELVQIEFDKRKKLGKQYSGTQIFGSKLVCGDCGCFFGSKVWHSTSKYRRVIWQCNSKFKGSHLCTTPHLYEEEIKQRFMNAFSEFFQGRDTVIETVQVLIETLSDNSDIDAKKNDRLNKIKQLRQIIIQLTETDTPVDTFDELPIAESVAKITYNHAEHLNISVTLNIYQSSKKFLNEYHPGKYDAAFLDIEMPELNGDALSAELTKTDSSLLLVYVTNYCNGEVLLISRSHEANVTQQFLYFSRG